MALGEGTYCRGVDVYNLCATDETAVSVTTYVGHSTSTGPKVAIRKKTHVNDAVVTRAQVIGTIEASIYRKNPFQDNSKYSIRKNKRKKTMEKTNPLDIIEKAIGNGKDVIGIITLTEGILRIVSEGTLTIAEAEDALCKLRANLEVKDGMQDPAEGEMPNGGARSDGDADSEEEMCIVRRLTPTETARLQGFPDDYTKIDGVETADAPQFKSHGNSWATPCANFVSTRIEMELRRLGHEGTIRYATCCSGIEAHSIAVRNLDWKALFFSEIEPFPCRVLEKHYPDVPNLGDMTQIHFDSETGAITNTHSKDEEYSLPACFREAPIQAIPFKVGDMEVFSGGTPCWAKGAMVLTASGYKPIEDIVVGDMVMTHRGRLRRVLRVGHKMPKALIEVKCHARPWFKVTPDHRFYTAHHSKNRTNVTFGEFGFRTIEDIGVGGYLMQPNSFDYPELPDELYSMKPYKMTVLDILEFAGWYVGDGYTRTWKGKSKKAVVLCLNQKKVEDFKKSFGDRINFSLCGKIGSEQPIQITCTRLANWLVSEFGASSQNKRIPSWLIASPIDYREAFMKGYSLTDGNRNVKDNEFKCTTISPSLAYGIADVLRKTAVSYYKVAPEREVKGILYKQHDQYHVTKASKSGHFKPADDSRYFGVVVQSIVPCAIEEVYNIEVEEDHSYICNGLVSSNCQSVSVAGKREGMAEGSGTRSSLAFHFQRIIDELQPKFLLWENVPGAFSSNGGADFIWFVNRCAESGYAMAWRVLDAQYTITEEFPRAVPQRRRRIWLVGYRGNDWRIPARILFERVKDLTDNPPDRIPGLGFKSLNPDADVEAIRNANKTKEDTKQDDGFLDLFAGMEDDSPKAKKVSQMIPLDDMPEESDFSKMTMVEIYEFAKKVGEPGYLGSVFRKDKKTAEMAFKQSAKYKEDWDWQSSEEAHQLFEFFKEKVNSGEIQWEGAEKVSPQILDNIGNAGILANGRILTMNCHEWTSGIQLSPKTYSAWEVVMQHKDWLKANDLLPEAYDETVCGLSDVLEDNPDEKYNLSWRACFGILRRAETRGKELPKALYIALISTIRENAPIVKWVALNGKDTKKKETDLSEKESAQICFERYISQVLNFDDIVPMPPKRKSDDESDIDDADGDEYEVDEDGNPILPEEDFGEIAETRMGGDAAEVPEMPNGCRNESGGETAPTIVASQYKGPGNTQDATVVADKKEVRFPEENPETEVKDA